ALKYYLEAASISKSTQNSNNIKSVYKSLAQTYEMLGNDNLSLENYKKYGLMTDSIMLANKDAITIPTDYLLKERDELLKTENHLQNLYLIFAICIALISFAIVVIFYKNNQKSKKHNLALNDANRQIIAQNEYLHETLTALEHSYEENNRVMQIIAHDLRSPMAAIVGLSGFMIEDHELSEEDMEVISLIHSSGKDSLTFISQILEKEVNEGALKTEPVDIFELLTYCTVQLQYKASDKKQTIVLSGSSLTIQINREKIWRVISNLITNAIIYHNNVYLYIS
ncbi:MAG: HAMP domain-containing histidine kinase, partial [Pedobacter sp.]